VSARQSEVVGGRVAYHSGEGVRPRPPRVVEVAIYPQSADLELSAWPKFETALRRLGFFSNSSVIQDVANLARVVTHADELTPAASVPARQRSGNHDRHHPRRARALPDTVPAPLRWVIERLLAKAAAESCDCKRDLSRELRQIREVLSQPASAL